MKRTLFAALTGVVLLAGCAKTEVTEVSDNRAISFSNFVTNSVKSIVNTEDLNKFYVYGGFDDNYDLFEDVEVTKADGAWTYDPTRYWTVHTYNFAAYSNSNSKAGVTATWDAVSNKHLSLDFNIQDAETDDLLYAAQSASWNGVDAAPIVDLHSSTSFQKSLSSSPRPLISTELILTLLTSRYQRKPQELLWVRKLPEDSILSTLGHLLGMPLMLHMMTRLY